MFKLLVERLRMTGILIKLGLSFSRMMQVEWLVCLWLERSEGTSYSTTACWQLPASVKACPSHGLSCSRLTGNWHILAQTDYMVHMRQKPWPLAPDHSWLLNFKVLIDVDARLFKSGQLRHRFAMHLVAPVSSREVPEGFSFVQRQLAAEVLILWQDDLCTA